MVAAFAARLERPLRTLIKNAFVVSVDPAIRNIDGADILIEDGIIREIRPGIEAMAEQIDASGCIAIPGLVDTHRHLWEGGMRAVTADWSIYDFISNIRLFAARLFRAEDMYATALQGGLESINAGVTTVAEYCHNVRTPEHAEEGLRGVRETGLRAVWSYGITGLAKDQKAFASVDDRLAYLERFAAKEFASKAQLITLGVCPEETSLWGADVEAVRRQFELARRLGARMFMHGNSRPDFNGNTRRDVVKLQRLGVLGPDLVMVHMCFTGADEWKMLGDAGSHVSYTPETEYQMGLGWPSATDPRAAGVNMCIGVDITANNSADMFFQLRCMLQVERARLIDEDKRVAFSRTPFDCADALYWGTMAGAIALGLDHKIGSLTPGKAADIVLLRADDISLTGWNRRNPEATVIQQAGVHNVDTVLIDGVVQKINGRLVGDAARACRLQQQTTDHVRRQADALGGFDVPERVVFERLGYTAGLAALNERAAT